MLILFHDAGAAARQLHGALVVTQGQEVDREGYAEEIDEGRHEARATTSK